MSTVPPPRVAVIGAGMSGVARARALRERGVGVELMDRARAVGGRMAAPTLHDRRVDVGAAYLTAKDEQFGAQVRDWAARGLVREWTDTFDVFGADGHEEKSGPMRWATPEGFRSLVRDLAPVDVGLSRPVDTLAELGHAAVVVAMPDPQAARLLGDAMTWVDYEPVIAVTAGFAQRNWPIEAAAFVNDDPDLTLIADDGSRRGDGAPVLVAHSTSDRARAHLDSPDDAVTPVLAALRRVLGVDVEPVWTHAHRWTFAKPAGTHGDEAYGLVTVDGRTVGVCSDSWCPSGAPRVESAWLSGHRLGVELADRLG